MMTHIIMLSAALLLDPIAAFLVQNMPDGWILEHYDKSSEQREDGFTLVSFYGTGFYEGTTNDFYFGAYALVPLPPTPSFLQVEESR